MMLLREVALYGRPPSLFDQSEWVNLLILGDNLPVLKGLMERRDVRGQVRLVYIDPPFATGQEYRAGADRSAHVSHSAADAVAYSDKFTREDYLRFLEPRLGLLRDVLADDGSIYVHIDCKMGHYVKVLMDRVFGEEHFINDITRVKCNPKNFERRAYGNIKDMVLFYSKREDYVWNGALADYTDDDIIRLFPKIDDNGRRYTTTPLHAPGETRNGPTGQAWRGLLPPKGRHWRYSPDELERLDGDGLVEWSSTGNPRKKIYADEFARKRKKRQDLWEFKDPPYPTYPTEKNLKMIEEIVKTSSNPGDLVLDCFAGSGTTLLAAEKMGRRWIGIDNSPAALQIAAKRLRDLRNVSAFWVLELADSSEALKEVVQQQGA